METARANIVVDTAIHENRGEGEDSHTYGEATFHAVGRLSLASVVHAFSRHNHENCSITYSEETGVGRLEDDWMRFKPGQVIEVPDPELEVQSILLEKFGKTTIEFKCLGEISAVEIDVFMDSVSEAEDGFHDYDASTPGSVRAVFMQRPQRTIEVGELFKI